jgi:predicted MFS family arabinose efflux permease
MYRSWQSQGYTILTLLTLVNLLNYFDRYILVAVVPAIQKEMSLSDVQIGFLGTAFMLCYFVVSPIFGWLGDRIHRFRLMGFGVGLWSLATGASGLASSYTNLLLARTGVGIGEASYVSVSPALMGDLFPKDVRGRVFAIFFMAIPVGSALGYLLGGLLESSWGWRHTLLLAAGPGLILAVIMFFMKDPVRGQHDKEDGQHEPPPLKEIASKLWNNHTYFFTVAGYIAYTFVVGGVSFWMPSYLLRTYHMELANANMIFGGVTVVAGFLGTIVGGSLADRWLKTDPHAYLKLSGLSALFAAFVFVFVLLIPNLTIVLIMIFFLEFFIFLSTSPVNAQLIMSVNASYRSTANAACVFLIHLFGDAISPTLIGAISDKAGLTTALFLGPIGILIAGALWFYGARDPKVKKAAKKS